MAVKYLVSGAVDLGEGLAWAKANSGAAAISPARQNKSARMSFPRERPEVRSTVEAFWRRLNENLPIPSQKRKAARRRPYVVMPMNGRGSEAHAAHPTHAATAAGHRRRRFLRQFGDHGLGGDQQAGDRRGVLQRGAHH